MMLVTVVDAVKVAGSENWLSVYEPRSEVVEKGGLEATRTAQLDWRSGKVRWRIADEEGKSRNGFKAVMLYNGKATQQRYLDDPSQQINEHKMSESRSINPNSAALLPL
jgi:hypothetical protein